MARSGRRWTAVLVGCGVAGVVLSEGVAVEGAGITAAPDGNLWVAEFGGNKIERITPAVFAEIAVYRATTGEWFIQRSSDAGLTQVPWGAPALGDVPVPARY